MPNRLKSLELNGYKTFATKTHFEFSGDITAIVGPNGSGKSNIADSLRWVLGEQSFRLLRGRRTDDMIFSGSENRPRAGMASATLTFDNADGWLPIDFSEVSITRRAYRDGNNEYLINRQRVRLRDVNELLSSSGLSERTYTVIGQGLVDTALTLKAEERRRLFEEAAGIGLYRNRKEQALRRLENTKRNLERVQDILSELGPRLRSLSRQAKRAEEYEQVRSDLQAVLGEWYGYHWHHSQQELQQTMHEVAAREKELGAAQQIQGKAEQSLAEIRDRINTLRSQLSSWHRQLSQIHTEREETSRELAVSGERRRALEEQESQTVTEIARLEEELKNQRTRVDEHSRRVEEARHNAAVAESELDSAQTALETRRHEKRAIEQEQQAFQHKINQLHARQAELGARKTELQARVARLEEEQARHHQALVESEERTAELESQVMKTAAAKDAGDRETQAAQQQRDQIRTELDQIQERRRELQAETTRLAGEIARMKAEHQVLVEAEDSFAGYAEGARLLLQAAQEGRFKSLAGALGSQLQVPEEFEAAIAAALGDFVDAVMFDDSGAPDSALELLEAEPNKAALLPLSELSPPQPLRADDYQGCLGVAADLVKTSPELRPAVDLLLGHVLVVEDRAGARKLLRGKDNQLRVVTLRGQVFHGGGAIVVDSGGRAAAFRRPRQRKELSERISEFEDKLSEVHQTLRDLDQRETAKREQLFASEGQVVEAQADYRRLADEHQSLNLTLEQAKSQLAWRRSQQQAIAREIEESQQRIESCEKDAIEAADDLAAVEAQQRTISSLMGGITLDEFISQVSYWEAQVSLGQQALEDVSQTLQEHRSTLAGQQLRLDEHKSRLESFRQQITDLDSRVNEMRASEGGIGSQIQELNALIDPAEVELAGLETQLSESRGEESALRQKTNLTERFYNQAQIALARKQESLDTLRQRIEADFGLVEFEYASDVPGPTPLPLGEVVQRLPVVTEISPDLEEALKQQRMHLRRLGAVNPDAQREYREVKERHEFLNQQLEDLRAAERDVREIISELDELMNREFRKTFDVVAVEFKEIFTRLFGGGSARLVLSESDDLNEVGIDIEARLPGKRTQQLALLSGGERSLTAAALVFSLIKASPTPFCVLDEVDAMLDEANVGRFREVLSDLSEQTQFVVITHNRHTVQAADVIYGITMGRDTTSQTISLKLEEVDERYSSA
jgi:chromosome segregation protein